jgi:hypothetical protein
VQQNAYQNVHDFNNAQNFNNAMLGHGAGSYPMQVQGGLGGGQQTFGSSADFQNGNNAHPNLATTPQTTTQNLNLLRGSQNSNMANPQNFQQQQQQQQQLNFQQNTSGLQNSVTSLRDSVGHVVGDTPVRTRIFFGGKV